VLQLGKVPARAYSVAIIPAGGQSEVRRSVESTLDADDGTLFLLAGEALSMPVADIALVVDEGDGAAACVEVGELAVAAFPGPILVISGEVAEAAVVRGYQAGAHDWLVAPLARAPFRAKLLSLGRRLLGPEDEDVEVHLCPRSARVTIDGELIALKPSSYELFVWLLIRREHSFSEDAILRDFYHVRSHRDTSLVRVQVGRIRAALGQHAWILRSGHGYGITLRRDSTAGRMLRPHPRFGSGTRRRVR